MFWQRERFSGRDNQDCCALGLIQSSYYPCWYVKRCYPGSKRKQHSELLQKDGEKVLILGVRLASSCANDKALKMHAFGHSSTPSTDSFIKQSVLSPSQPVKTRFQLEPGTVTYPGNLTSLPLGQPSAGLLLPQFRPAALTPTPGRSQPRSRVNTRPSIGSGFPASWERRVPPLGARSWSGRRRGHLGSLSPSRVPHLAPLSPGRRRTAQSAPGSARGPASPPPPPPQLQTDDCPLLSPPAAPPAAAGPQPGAPTS